MNCMPTNFWWFKFLVGPHHSRIYPFVGVPKLHGCTWFFSCTSRCNAVGIYETYCVTFGCWWCLPLLWEDILSVVFRYTGGKMSVWSLEMACNSWILTLPLYYFFQKVKHIKQLPVDMNAIKGSLSSLTVPSQKAMFSQHMYAMNF